MAQMRQESSRGVNWKCHQPIRFDSVGFAWLEGRERAQLGVVESINQFRAQWKLARAQFEG